VGVGGFEGNESPNTLATATTAMNGLSDDVGHIAGRDVHQQSGVQKDVHALSTCSNENNELGILAVSV